MPHNNSFYKYDKTFEPKGILTLFFSKEDPCMNIQKICADIEKYHGIITFQKTYRLFVLIEARRASPGISPSETVLISGKKQQLLW